MRPFPSTFMTLISSALVRVPIRRLIVTVSIPVRLAIRNMIYGLLLLFYVLFAFDLALAKAGRSMLARMAMIAITTNSSMSVKALTFLESDFIVILRY